MHHKQISTTLKIYPRKKMWQEQWNAVTTHQKHNRDGSTANNHQLKWQP